MPTRTSSCELPARGGIATQRVASVAEIVAIDLIRHQRRWRGREQRWWRRRRRRHERRRRGGGAWRDGGWRRGRWRARREGVAQTARPRTGGGDGLTIRCVRAHTSIKEHLAGGRNAAQAEACRPIRVLAVGQVWNERRWRRRRRRERGGARRQWRLRRRDLAEAARSWARVCDAWAMGRVCARIKLLQSVAAGGLSAHVEASDAGILALVGMGHQRR